MAKVTASIEDLMVYFYSATAGSASIESSSSLSSEKRRQWASCHTLSSKEGLEDSRPVGKLQRMNPDGTQVVELTRPPNGPLGFFIAQGSSKYKQGMQNKSTIKKGMI